MSLAAVDGAANAADEIEGLITADGGNPEPSFYDSHELPRSIDALNPSSTVSSIFPTTTDPTALLPDKLRPIAAKPAAPTRSRRLICADPGHGVVTSVECVVAIAEFIFVFSLPGLSMMGVIERLQRRLLAASGSSWVTFFQSLHLRGARSPEPTKETSMKRTVRKTTIAFCLTLPFVAAAFALAQDQTSKGKITVEYGPSALTEIAANLKQRMVLEELQQFLAPLRLPKDLKITARDCGAQTVPYTPGGPVTICYDSIAQIVEEAKKIYPQDAFSQNLVITGATIAVVLHETAHAIFDILQVPIWGREDDAADRLAALLMMQFGEDMEKVTIYGTTTYFKALAESEKAWSGSDYANRASADAQRYFNYLCIAAAADPSIFGGALRTGTIPQFRAADCSHEYQQIVTAFYLRIMPYVDPGAMVKVRATQWLNWSPGNAASAGTQQNPNPGNAPTPAKR